jgi:hypothetical protein
MFGGAQPQKGSGQGQDQLDILLGNRARHRGDYQGELDARDAQLASLNESIGPDSAKWRMRSEAKHEAHAQLGAIQGQLGRPLQRWSLSLNALIFFAVACALLEAPLNQFIFEIVLRRGAEVAFVASFAVGLGLILIAHTGGGQARQWYGVYERKIYFTHIFLAAFCLVVIACVVGALTVTRADLPQGDSQAGIGDVYSSVADRLNNMGLLATLSAALANSEARTLAAMNLGTLFAAFLMGVVTHDPDVNFDRAYDLHEARKRALERLDRKYKKRRARIRADASRDLQVIDGKYSSTNAAIITLKHLRGIGQTPDDAFVLSSLDLLLTAERQQAFRTRLPDEAATPPQPEAPPPAAPARDGALHVVGRETR